MATGEGACAPQRWNVRCFRASVKMRFIMAALIIAVSDVHAATWLTDISTAYHQARTEKKVLLFNFTGSDWCGWCMKLKAEVFTQPEFDVFAKDNLVLVEVDFPRRKELTPAQKRANMGLALQYNVQGYPTIILADGQGIMLGRTGYQPGGAKMYVKELQRILGNNLRVPFKDGPAATPPAASPPASAPERPIFGGAPTAPPTVHTGLQLKGISGSKTRLAIINNETLGPGEAVTMKLADRQVRVQCKEIRENSVVLKLDDAADTVELQLGDAKPFNPAAMPVLRKK